MIDHTDAQLDALRRQIRERGKELPSPVEKLARAVLGESGADLSHEECLAALPTYVDAEVAGEPIAQNFPRVKRHLDACEECSAQYAELLQMTLAEQSGEIPMPLAIPAPDLAFLSPPKLSDFVTEKARTILRAISSAPLPDLERIAEIVSEQIEALGGKFVLQPGLARQLALDSSELSEATVALAVTYAVTQRIIKSLTPEQIDVLFAENRLQAQVENVAIATAREIRVETSLAERLAQEYARHVCADPDVLRALVKQYHNE
jgi:hypothetical protein